MKREEQKKKRTEELEETRGKISGGIDAKTRRSARQPAHVLTVNKSTTHQYIDITFEPDPTVFYAHLYMSYLCTCVDFLNS